MSAAATGFDPNENVGDVAPKFDFGVEFSADAARHTLETARQQLDAATAEARHVARLLAEHGRSELEIAARLGVTRRTVRRWIGRPA